MTSLSCKFGVFLTNDDMKPRYTAAAFFCSCKTLNSTERIVGKPHTGKMPSRRHTHGTCCSRKMVYGGKPSRDVGRVARPGSRWVFHLCRQILLNLAGSRSTSCRWSGGMGTNIASPRSPSLSRRQTCHSYICHLVPSHHRPLTFIAPYASTM